MLFLNAILYVAMVFGVQSPQYPGFEWNKKSTLTTDHQVEFPGIVLDPGVYVIRVRESGEQRSTVDIMNQDESKVLASVIAVPDHRTHDGDSEFTFHAVVGNGPAPVQSWFHTGDMVGLEFVYPKGRARQIARASNGYVMAMNGGKDDAIVAVVPNGKEIVVEDAVAQTARQKPQ